MGSTAWIDGEMPVKFLPTLVHLWPTIARGWASKLDAKPQGLRGHIAKRWYTGYGVPRSDDKCRVINTLYEGDKGCR